MSGPPPEIQGSLGMGALWRMWKRRRSRDRASSIVSGPSHQRVPHFPLRQEGKERRGGCQAQDANLLLPLLAKRKKDALLQEWHKKATCRNKVSPQLIHAMTRKEGH